jgi:predicted methyltransferase
MRRLAVALLSASLVFGGTAGAQSVDTVAAIAEAVTDPVRPDADRARDAARKPAEIVAFAGVKPGDVVA